MEDPRSLDVDELRERLLMARAAIEDSLDLVEREIAGRSVRSTSEEGTATRAAAGATSGTGRSAEPVDMHTGSARVISGTDEEVTEAGWRNWWHRNN